MCLVGINRNVFFLEADIQEYSVVSVTLEDGVFTHQTTLNGDFQFISGWHLGMEARAAVHTVSQLLGTRSKAEGRRELTY